jgi:hypothetical protein
VTAAVDERIEPGRRPDVERTDALRRIELVARERQQVEAADVHLDLADRLRGIGVQGHAVLARDVGDLRDRLQRADLVCWRG